MFVARRPKRIEADTAGRSFIERAAKMRVVCGEKRVDAVERAKKRARLFRDAIIGDEKMANFAPVDRMASRKAEPANSESCKLSSRHEIQARARVPTRDCSNRGNEAEQIAQSARENHEYSSI
jgi:hypothetical protein